MQWADKGVAILGEPPEVIYDWVTAPRLYEKLGWLEAFADDVAVWSEWQAVVDSVVSFVNGQGIYRGMAAVVRAELPPGLCTSSRNLAGELVGFVAEQARRTRLGERLPGSTEVLESCFGRFKQLEKQQARGRFTSLELGFGAPPTETTTEATKKARQQKRTKQILTSRQEQRGKTMRAQRKRDSPAR